MPATLTIQGLLMADPKLLDEMSFPSGLDPDTVKAAIVQACAPFEVLIPQPALCKQWLKYFSLRRAPIWEKLYQTTVRQYDMLTDSDYTDTVQGTDNSTRTPDLQTVRSPDMTTEGQNGGSDTVEEQVSAFNSSEYANRQKQTSTLGTTNRAHTSGTETTTETGTDTTEKERSENRTQIGRHTSAADLIAKERETAVFDVVRYIAEDVKESFCIMVY